MNCCKDLFSGFSFQSLRLAEPPDEKGVYVIRIKQRGQDTDQIIARVQRLLEKLDWDVVESFVGRRIERLKNIADCPVIYIGANRNRGRNTLSDRYKELANRHTIMYPMWALVYHSWDFDLGWQVTSDPQGLKRRLIREYRRLHEGNLPALMGR